MSVAVALTLAAVLTTASGCTEPNTYQPPPPPEVTVAEPTARRVADVVEFTGSVRASERVDIRARVKGFLESYHYREGEPVEAGAKLFVIDPKPFQADVDAAGAAQAVAQAQVETAKSGVNQARARAANASAQLARATQAAQGGAVTEAELDDLRTDREVAIADFEASKAEVLSAEAQVKVAVANLAQAELELGYTVVSAPIDGRVSQRKVDVGNLVGAGEPTLLAEMVKYDPVHVYFTVTEREYLEHIRKRSPSGGGKDATLEEEQVVVRVGLEGEEGFPHAGRLDYADLEIDSSTGTYKLRAVFENPDNQIPPGARARIRLTGEEQDALLVPDAAIGRSPSGSFVIVVDAKGACQRRAVTIGRLVDGLRVVSTGLDAGDSVVVDGLQRARPGVTVKPVSAGAPPATPAPPAEPPSP